MLTKEGINAAMKAAASASFGYNEDPIVSSDVIGMRFGSLFDATQTMVAKIADDLYEVQVVSWYDNENSYTSQMVRTIKYFMQSSASNQPVQCPARKCGAFFMRFFRKGASLWRCQDLEEILW